MKSKTESGTKFKATTVNNTEKSVTQSGLESEFAWPDYGNALICYLISHWSVCAYHIINIGTTVIF